MSENAEMANEKTKNQSEPNDESKYTPYTLDVKGREFKISNADLKIGDIKHHPATRIVFDDPRIEWIIYFLDGTYYNVLWDENGNSIIPTVKSVYQPWEEDTKRDRKITEAFNLKGWKRTEAAQVLNVVHAAYINHRELGEFLFQPQLVMMEADETDNDNPNPKTAQITASDIIYLIENDVLKNELKNKMFSVDGRPYLVIPHCEGIMTRDTVGIPSYDHMDIDHGIKNMYNLTDKGSETLRSELQRLCRIKHGMTAKNAVIKEAISAFQGDANKNKKIAVNRVQYLDGTLYYDFMLERDNKIAKITKDGVEMINDISMMNPDDDKFVFMRFPHQLPQEIPSDSGNIKLLDRYYDLQDDEKTLLLEVDTTVSYFPHLHQPLKQFSGPSGVGKTKRCQFMSSLIDPNSRKKGIEINDKTSLDHFVRLIYQSYFVYFDNMSTLSKAQNDILAKAVTGLSYTARKLYTDDDMINYPDFTRPICINGIVTKGTESDVLERTNLFEVKEPLKHINDNLLVQQFERDKPDILSAIFTILSKAIGYLDTIENEIEIPENVRLRDYALYSCAITKAMGHDPNRFLDIYLKTFEEKDYKAIESNPLGAVLIQLMGVEPSFIGTPDELLGRLQIFIQERAITVGYGFPHDAKSLGTHLAKIEKNLKAIGIDYIHKRSNGVRTYVIGNTRFKTNSNIKPLDMSESGSAFKKSDGM